MIDADKIKVLIVAAGPPLVGGQSVQAQTLIEKLPESGELEVGFVPINPTFLAPLQKIKFVRTFVTLLGFIISLLRNVSKYDIIHVFSASYFSFLIGPLPAIIIGRFFGKKVLLNYHSAFLQDHLEKWPLSTKIFFNECDQIVVPSGYLKEVFEENDFRSEVVHNSVDLSLFSFRKRENVRPKFLSNRNFEDLYNVMCVLEAFALIKEVYPEAELTVAGSGPEEKKLKQFVENRRIESVDFVGKVGQEEMARLYSESDIYLNTPDMDNMPVSVLEAFASGTLVISTNVGGIPYIVEDGRTGLLVDKNDHRSVRKAVIDSIENPERVIAITEAAARDVEEYLWEKVGSEWSKVYANLKKQF